MARLSILDAVRFAQYEEMKRDPRIFIMGEDVRTNAFGTTSGFLDEFGEQRILNTPIVENGFVGAAVGAAIVGARPIVDLTIAPFVYPAMDQIINTAAKFCYLFGGQMSVPLVIRAVMFYGGANAAQHSDRPYSLFMHVPGLKIIAPSNPYDMKGLLKSAIRDDNPVLCFEDATLWSAKAEVPDEDYLVPIGKARIAREGADVTITANSGAVKLALAAAETLAEDGISAEVVDLRSLAPLDRETILQSVAKTGRLVAVDVAHRTCSAASEIAASVAEQGFSYLKAPILRVTTPDTHIPFSPPLEKSLYPTAERIVGAVRAVMA